MDAPSQFSIFSDEAIAEIAQLVGGMIDREDLYVTAMFEEFDVDSNMASYGPDTHGARSIEVARTEQRIDDICQIIHLHPPWDYDFKKYPVMIFSIESNRNYYGIIAVATSKEVEGFNDAKLARAVLAYIRAHPPEPFEEDMESWIEARYAYGVIANRDFCFVYNPDEV